MIVAVFGAEGRVGSAAVRIARQRGHVVVPIDIKYGENREKHTETDLRKENTVKNAERIDVVVDFSVAEATAEVCEFCRAHRCPLVTGVTGRDEKQCSQLEALAAELPVVAKANFSEGVNLLLRLVEETAKALYDWDCEIVETHRREKKDAPSGTAIKLAAVVAQRKNFSKVTVHSLRCGSNFGRHSVIFAANGESLTLTHQAESTDIFAKGAIKQAELLLAAQNVPNGEAVRTVDGE